MVELLLGILGLTEATDIVVKGAIALVLLCVAFILYVTYKMFAGFFR